MSLLALAEVDGEQLPEEILISFLRQLVNAGGDTTYRATSVLLTGLLTQPDQLDAIRQDRSLIPQAIEEALRWDGPVLIATRTPTMDTELCGVQHTGRRLPVGGLGLGQPRSARFENPDRFDIFRKKQRNFGFAFGAHVCIGQHLARIEMTRALNAILDRLPNIRLDPALPPPAIQGTMMRVPKHIHVCFD